MTLDEMESLVPTGWLWSLRKQATGDYLATVMKLGKPGQQVYEQIEQAEKDTAAEAFRTACAAAALLLQERK